MKRASFLLAASLLLIGAGCAKTDSQAPVANVPAVNAPADVGSNTNGGSAGAGATNAPVTSTGGATKQYQSAPYDFSYPSKYIISDRAMTSEAQKPYLDRGLDAPLQYSMFATEVRPPGFVGEGPASVRVILWNNSQRQPLWEWGKRHGAYTGLTAQVEAVKKFQAESFMGRPSISYEYDGLYGGKARLIDLGGTVLEVGADFDGASGTNMAAFDMILSTLKLAK